MIDALGWLGTLFVAAAMLAFATRRMRIGFALSILSTGCWSFVAAATGLWPLLALQAWIAGCNVWGLIRK